MKGECVGGGGGGGVLRCICTAAVRDKENHQSRDGTGTVQGKTLSWFWKDVAVPESVQLCFGLPIHFPVLFPRTIFNSSLRLARWKRSTDKYME